jgi:hypothetical protein
MNQYRFWTTITVNGVKQRREFVFTAASWTTARQMLSAAMKESASA